MDSLEKPLLEKSIGFDDDDVSKHSDIDEDVEQHKSSSLRRQSHQRIFLFVILQLLLIILYTVVFLFVGNHWSSSQRQRYPEIISSPARDAIQYEQRYFDKQGHLTSPYSGPPSPALDNAWHKLLEGMNIRVSEEVLKPYNTTSVRLSNGDGFIAQLGLYHELHCLKKLKHWIYKEHYHPTLTADKLFEEKFHIEHCLEWIRVAALCRSDTTLTTFAWAGHPAPFRLETEYPIPRQCVNSDHLLQWSLEHSVDINVPGVLERPEGEEGGVSKSIG